MLMTAEVNQQAPETVKILYSPMDEIPVSRKDEIVRAVLDEYKPWYGCFLESVPSFLKRQVDNERNRARNNGGEFDFLDYVKGRMRGIVGERLNGFTKLEDAETVFSSGLGKELKGARVADFYEFVDESLDLKGKAAVLATSVKHGMSHPGSGLIMSLTPEVDDTIVDKEIVEGYATHGGVFDIDASIPDAALVDDKNHIIGAVEIKSYTSDETHAWVKSLLNDSFDRVHKKTGEIFRTPPVSEQNFERLIDRKKLGANFEKLLKFSENFRTGFEGRDLGFPEKAIFVLRFPSDANDKDLKQLGELMNNYGYRNVVIQELPFSCEEINDLSKEVLEILLENGKLAEAQFGKKDMEKIKSL